MEEILIQVSSGRGPAECCKAVALIVDELCREGAKAGLAVAVLEEEAGPEPATMMSALLHVEGEGCSGFATSWEGTVLWTCPSPYRPGHRRKNWFADVRQVPVSRGAQFLEKDIRFETCKAGGPGGQHVNSTESAVKAIHIPTGLVATSRDERSQGANRKRAIQRLAILVARHAELKEAAGRKERWDAHNSLERGLPVRSYEGTGFARVR